MINKGAKAIAGGMPSRVELELSSHCNLSCSCCPRRFLDDISAYMDYDLFCGVIDELQPYEQTTIVLHSRGESLLHPRFLECMDYIRGKFSTLQMATNATLLDKARAQSIASTLNFISFSLDIPARYSQTHAPADYQKVEENVLRFLDLNRGRVKTQVSMVAIEGTSAEDREAFRARWIDKVDRVRIYAEHSADGHFGSLSGEQRPQRSACVMPVYQMTIFSSGSIQRCNHDWGGESLGTFAHTGDLHKIWTGPVYEDLRRQHQELNITDKVCSNCDSWYPVEGQQQTGWVYERK